MDEKTLNAYSEKANEYSQDWLAQPEPIDMYQLLERFFINGGITADIGCGNGRDSNWLALNGFKVTGYDSSEKLLELAANLFPEVKFKQALLPSLQEIPNQFENVLCETVIMHLPVSEIPKAIENFKRLLVKGGILYLSWRVTEGKDSRHKDGRLYSSFEPALILGQFHKNSILHFEDKISEGSGKRVCRLIYRNDWNHWIKLNSLNQKGVDFTQRLFLFWILSTETAERTFMKFASVFFRFYFS